MPIKLGVTEQLQELVATGTTGPVQDPSGLTLEERVDVIFQKAAGGIVLGFGTSEVLVPDLNCSVSYNLELSADAHRPDFIEPEEIAELVSDTWGAYWVGAHHSGHGLALSNSADHRASTYRTHGLWEAGKEPRGPYDTSPTSPFRDVVNHAWNWFTTVDIASIDAQRAIEVGFELDPQAPLLAEQAFARTLEGLGRCEVAKNFDRGFSLDQLLDPGGQSSVVGYQDLQRGALVAFDESISLSSSGFSGHRIPWGGRPISNDELAELTRGFRAMCRMDAARDEGVDWSSVEADLLDSAPADQVFQAQPGTYFRDGLGAGSGIQYKLDMNWLGGADQSGQHQARMALPVQARTAFAIDSTPDSRIPPSIPGALSCGAPSPGSSGNSCLQYLLSSADPGAVNNAGYQDSHYAVVDNDGSSAEMFEVTREELDLRLATARYFLGNFAGAVALINKTRERAGLTGVTGVGPVPSEVDGSCVPRLATGACGDLLNALWWEWYLEVFTRAGVQWFNVRRHGQLPANTPLNLDFPTGTDDELLQSVLTHTHEALVQTSLVPVGAQSMRFSVASVGQLTDPVPTSTFISGNPANALSRAAFTLERLRTLLEEAAIRFDNPPSAN